MNTCLKKVVVVSLCAMQLFSDTQAVVVNFENGSRSVSFNDGQTWHDINREIHEKGFLPKENIDQSTCFYLTHADDKKNKLLTICGDEHASDSAWWDKKVAASLNSKQLQDYRSSDIRATAVSSQNNLTTTAPHINKSHFKLNDMTLHFKTMNLKIEGPHKKSGWVYSNHTGSNLTGIDLSEVNLALSTLKYASLNKALLAHANLSAVNLSYADLSDANLTGADLEGATLIEACLENANLTGTILIRTAFNGSTLENANLSDANLTNASLNNTFLGGVIFNKNTILKDANFTNAKGLSPENKAYAVAHGAIFED